MSRDPYLKLEQRIAADERGGILHRWTYGRLLLTDPKKVNPAGTLLRGRGIVEGLVATAKASGRKLSEREIQSRLKCARTYTTEAAISQVAATYDNWTALVSDGFPPVEGVDPDDPEMAELAAPADEWEQLTLIPGLKPVLSIRGRKVPLDEATVADVAEYHDMFAQMHASFGKTLALIEASLETMRDGSDDDTANAVEAFKRGAGDDELDGIPAVSE